LRHGLAVGLALERYRVEEHCADLGGASVCSVDLFCPLTDPGAPVRRGRQFGSTVRR